MPLHFVTPSSRRTLFLLALVCALTATGAVHARMAKGNRTVRLLLRDGKILEGAMAGGSFNLNGTPARPLRPIREDTLLSLHLAGEASPHETERINAGLAAIQGTDRKVRDTASAELTDIGLAALTPVLNGYKDRDMREPDALYRLFGRLVPGYADTADRTLDLIRLKNGEALRGRLGAATLTIQPAGGTATQVPLSGIRSIALREARIEKTFDVHALRHCTQIEFLDTGVIIDPASRVEVSATGYVRLAFATDGWASDPDGLKVPGPNYKTNLVDGFPFGALVGRIGAAGPRFMVGQRLDKTGLGAGRLYLAVNDNGHWQNNIGSFRVKMRVSEAYDIGDPQ
ncbi:MAG: hypothetical protein ACKV2V_21455 [Blastocatellia bacterium]